MYVLCWDWSCGLTWEIGFILWETFCAVDIKIQLLTHSLVLCRQTLADDLDTVSPFTERKFIVFETQLLELLGICRVCSKPCNVQKKEECGTSVESHFHCFCGNKFRWRSQPFSYRLPLGNLVLAAAAFFTACSPTRLLRVFVQDLQQPAGLLPGSLIRSVWQRCQERLFSARRGKNIKLAGDGRCDSAGHCAKYGSYTLMDAET